MLTVREIFCAARILRNLRYPGFWPTAKPRCTVVKAFIFSKAMQHHRYINYLQIINLIVYSNQV